MNMKIGLSLAVVDPKGSGVIAALNEDFTNGAVSLDPLITFSRASSATYFDSAGVLQTAGTGVARAHAYQDYNPSTLSALGFLIEEQRTNLLLYSAEFDNAAWGKSSCTITANTVTSPDGTTTGDTLTTTVAGGAMNQTTQAFSAGSTVNVTVFAKKNTSNFLRMELGGLVNCWFNLNTGATATNSAGSGNVLFSAKSIQAINNGWYRCVLTVTTTTVTTLGVLLFATDTDGNTSSINSSIYLWGAQAEVGAFATSYIATTTAAATRLVDDAQITGTNFSGWYNQSAGTFVVNAAIPILASNRGPLHIDDGTTNNRVLMRDGSSGLLDNRILVGGVTQCNLESGNTITANVFFKAAFAFTLNDAASAFNGGNLLTDAALTIPTVDRMRIGDGAANPSSRGCRIKTLSYYRSRLSNASLQSLTT
jgi:hypothetical protein